MPRKSIREMSLFERRQNSLSAKTFNWILLLLLIICSTAIGFGFFLYTDSMEREYRTSTYDMALTMAGGLEQRDVLDLAQQVLSIYDSAPQEQTETYLQSFEAISEQPVYEETLRKIRHMRQGTSLVAGYVAALDTERGRMIYIVDSDPDPETACAPGSWDPLPEKPMKDLIQGAPTSALDRLYESEPVPSIIMTWEEYGYRCTSGAKLFEVRGYPVMMFCDTDMNQVEDTESRFLLQYIMILLVIGLLSGLALALVMKRLIVDPVNRMADAAQAYSTDKQNRMATGNHFEDLDIHTGDELENLSLTLKDMEGDLRDYVQDLTHVTAEKERINTELNVASAIQEGMIPHIYPAFPDRPEFEVYASMQAAKEVGGDFYDYFLIDEDHLALVMADVSGKGIPAALFMMASKIMLSNVARMYPDSPARILAEVNDQICENNPAEMFVTVWLGILELSTGRLKAANAGHEYPVVRKTGGRYELYKDKHGFVLGGMEGMVYHDYEIALEPGDRLFQYTDGVTEATNPENQLFGEERMLAVLNEDCDAAPDQVLESMSRAVMEFTGDASQFDDVTMLCLKYNGTEPAVKGGSALEANKIKITALKSNLPEVLQFVEGCLEKAECPIKTMMQISIAVEEIFVNIASYAYAPETGQAEIGVLIDEEQSLCSVIFEDRGVPYDPLAKEDPDVTLSAEERQIGGLGVYMVKESMDEVDYEYRDGKNVLTLKKHF